VKRHGVKPKPKVARHTIVRLVPGTDENGNETTEVRHALVPGKGESGVYASMRKRMTDQMRDLTGAPPEREHSKDKGPRPKPRRNVPPGARRKAGDNFTPHAPKEQP
jgi:hypothetical protein